MMYSKEYNTIRSGFDDSMWECLAENGCIIAGGAVTNVFTQQPINDFDVYFPSKEAFTKVFKEVYKESWNDYRDSEFGIDFGSGIVSVVTKKALLLFRGESKIQFIVHDFYQTVEEIFDDFDFTVCMGALNMKDNSWSFNTDFFKHNSQRYLHFNSNTAYPLVSALRVDKYKKKGYNISKAQMFKILSAVNAKNIDNWETLMDEMGGMYGCKPEEIFDTSQPFSMDAAMEALDKVEIKDTVVANGSNHALILKIIKHAFTDEYLSKYLKD